MFIETTDRTVNAWLSHLIVMVSPHTDKDAGREIFAAYVPGLAKRFPPRVFCPASAEAVAAECKRWPAYGVLVDLLRKWSTENPDRLSLQDQRADPLKPADRRWVNFWHRRMEDGFSRPDGSAPQDLETARATCLSLVRSQSMAAFVEINGPDLTGEECVEGWHDHKALQRTLDRLDYNEDGLPAPLANRAMLLGCIRRMVGHAAPELLHMLPPVVAGEDREDTHLGRSVRMPTGLGKSRAYERLATPGAPEPIQRSRADDLAHLEALRARAANPALSDTVRSACAQTAQHLGEQLLGDGAGA